MGVRELVMRYSWRKELVLKGVAVIFDGKHPPLGQIARVKTLFRELTLGDGV